MDNIKSDLINQLKKCVNRFMGWEQGQAVNLGRALLRAHTVAFGQAPTEDYKEHHNVHKSTFLKTEVGTVVSFCFLKKDI